MAGKKDRDASRSGRDRDRDPERDRSRAPSERRGRTREREEPAPVPDDFASLDPAARAARLKAKTATKPKREGHERPPTVPMAPTTTKKSTRDKSHDRSGSNDDKKSKRDRSEASTVRRSSSKRSTSKQPQHKSGGGGGELVLRPKAGKGSSDKINKDDDDDDRSLCSLAPSEAISARIEKERVGLKPMRDGHKQYWGRGELIGKPPTREQQEAYPWRQPPLPQGAPMIGGMGMGMGAAPMGPSMGTFMPIRRSMAPPPMPGSADVYTEEDQSSLTSSSYCESSYHDGISLTTIVPSSHVQPQQHRSLRRSQPSNLAARLNRTTGGDFFDEPESMEEEAERRRLEGRFTTKQRTRHTYPPPPGGPMPGQMSMPMSMPMGGGYPPSLGGYSATNAYYTATPTRSATMPSARPKAKPETPPVEPEWTPAQWAAKIELDTDKRSNELLQEMRDEKAKKDAEERRTREMVTGWAEDYFSRRR